jgi:hypothetical protein
MEPDAQQPDAQTPPTEDDAIRTLVARLARPGNDQGHVIERAAIMAAGSQSAAIEAWIVAHAGHPEPIESSSPTPSGLHGDRHTSVSGINRTPLRFLLPPGVL